MTPENFPAEAEALCGLGQLFAERGWCMATSGNFSLRVTKTHCLITQSGREKSLLTPADLMVCDLNGFSAEDDSTPSAETPLHTCLYRLDAQIGAVLHTHSVDATVVSRAVGSALTFGGFEMAKALQGIPSHEASINVLVFDNDQDIDALAGEVEDAWSDGRITVPGFLIRGHGLYAWGSGLDEARRHIEGFEFLLKCVWQEMLASSR